jgi:flagellin-like hook-associated protein FlgL
MSNVSLTVGMRNSLFSINDITTLTNTANKRLATGKRVNDVLDNATNFFQARAFNSLGNDLNTLQDNISLNIKTIEVATKALDGIEKLLGSALGLVRQARALATGAPERATLNTQATTALTQITNLANDAGFNGRNLLKATPDSLQVNFNTETGGALTFLTVAGVDTTNGATGLNVVIAGVTDANLDTAITDITNAITTVRTRASNLSSSLAIVQTRQDYNRSKVQSLRTGADVLTLADMNEEGANLASLQTRQQLAVQALSLANQADQGILRLF